MADSLVVSIYAGIDEAVMEERRRGRELLNEAQASLEVARREQTKTALQLQRSQRKVCVWGLFTVSVHQCTRSPFKLERMPRIFGKRA